MIEQKKNNYMYTTTILGAKLDFEQGLAHVCKLWSRQIRTDLDGIGTTTVLVTYKYFLIVVSKLKKVILPPLALEPTDTGV